MELFAEQLHIQKCCQKFIKKYLNESTALMIKTSSLSSDSMAEDLSDVSVLAAKVKCMSDNFASVTLTLNDCLNKISGFGQLADELTKKLTFLDVIKAENESLRSEVALLNSRIDSLEQYSRQCRY